MVRRSAEGIDKVTTPATPRAPDHAPTSRRNRLNNSKDRRATNRTCTCRRFHRRRYCRCRRHRSRIERFRYSPYCHPRQRWNTPRWIGFHNNPPSHRRAIRPCRCPDNRKDSPNNYRRRPARGDQALIKTAALTSRRRPLFSLAAFGRRRKPRGHQVITPDKSRS